MNNIKRYGLISNSLLDNLKYENEKLIYKNEEINIIESQIPDFINSKLEDLTNEMASFYDQIKFPNYDDFEDYSSLYKKGVTNSFTRRIDEEINYGVNILELGCGTGQLSLFLARGNRKIYGVDISNSSLKMGEEFRKKSQLENVFFMRMDLFDLKFKENYFDYIISNGVLHHTINPEEGFKSLVKVLKPGGIIIIGLYHKYGRFFTIAKQQLAKLIGNNIFLLDQKAREMKSIGKRNAWVMDQFFNPHELRYIPKDILFWFRENNIEFLNLIPHCDSEDLPIFSTRKIPKFSTINELSKIFNMKQITEGGFFIMIGKKRQ